MLVQRLQRLSSLEPPLGQVSRSLGHACAVHLSGSDGQCWPNAESLAQPLASETRDIDPMLDQWGSTVYDGGPTLDQHWVDVSCLSGRYSQWLWLSVELDRHSYTPSFNEAQTPIPFNSTPRNNMNIDRLCVNKINSISLCAVFRRLNHVIQLLQLLWNSCVKTLYSSWKAPVNGFLVLFLQ